jgi:hypothetical protein
MLGHRGDVIEDHGATPVGKLAFDTALAKQLRDNFDYLIPKEKPL